MEALKLFLTALCSALALFGIAKLMGRKQMIQLDFFDYITGITIGSIAAEMATELEKPWKPLLAMLVYGGISVGLSLLTNHFPRSRKFINGEPTVLMHGGKLSRSALKKAKLDLSEFLAMCRQAGYFDIRQIHTAVYEFNGRLTVLPQSTDRPVTPADLSLQPSAAGICTEVILDGKIQEQNLKKVGLDRRWLQNRLKEQNYSSEREVFLAFCDSEKHLVVHPMKEP